MKTVGEGAYVMYDAFIAFRDNMDSKWRLSQFEATAMNEMKLNVVGVYDHLWQVNEYVENHSD